MTETIGQRLKQARETRSLTLKKISQSTRIQVRLLEAMEANDFEALPSPVQARAFLRLYAEYLGISFDELTARQENDTDSESRSFLGLSRTPIQGQDPEETPSSTKASSPVETYPKDIFSFFQKQKQYLYHRFRDIQKKYFSDDMLPMYPKEPPQEAKPKIKRLLVQPESGFEGGTEEEQATPYPPIQYPWEYRESQAIFASIGRTLQNRREALSLTIDEIENHTHVRKHYLQALESGNFGHLPSSVQTRGMLNNYAHFLDLDVEAILLRFAEGLQAQRAERQPVPVEKKGKTKEKKSIIDRLPAIFGRVISVDILVGGGLVFILLVFAIWGTARVISLQSIATPQPTAQPISALIITSPQTATIPQTPANGTETSTLVPTATSTVLLTTPGAGQGPVQVVLIASEQAFVRVTVDGKILFDGRVSAGTAYPFNGNTQIEVLTGNGAAISVQFNQSNLGPMGGQGQVVDRIYTAKSVLSPTATFTPTPTVTPTPTITPRSSPTPRPSPTPKPTTTLPING